jgi:Holliday junction DNA helicase RuvB
MFEEEALEITENIDHALRPQKFEDYVGQKSLIEKLKIAVQAAKERNDPVPSILIAGGSGKGKTTIASIIANEYGTECKIVMAPVIKDVSDILELLVKATPNSFLFIDELHRLNGKVEECLYSAIEDFKASIRVAGKNISHIDINPFCLIGATTEIGKVSEPLRNRFGLVHILEDYTDEELVTLCRANVSKIGLDIRDDEIFLSIAKRCRGIPRILNRILYQVRDYAQVNNNNTVDLDCFNKAMELEGIDENGLQNIDTQYLVVLYRNFAAGPAGINAICSAMGGNKDFIEQTVEPFLLRNEYLSKTKGGRVLTEKGLKYAVASVRN